MDADRCYRWHWQARLGFWDGEQLAGARDVVGAGPRHCRSDLPRERFSPMGAKRTWSIYEYSLGKRRCRRLVLLDPVLLHHNIADVRAQIPEQLLLMQRLAARVPKRHLDDLAHARRTGGDD